MKETIRKKNYRKSEKNENLVTGFDRTMDDIFSWGMDSNRFKWIRVGWG